MNTANEKRGTTGGAGTVTTQPARGGNGTLSRAEIEHQKIEKLRDEVAYYKARTRIAHETLKELTAQLENEKRRASAGHGRSEESSAGEEATAATRANTAAGPLPPISDESNDEEPTMR